MEDSPFRENRNNTTIKFLAAGILGAALLNAPFYAFMNDEYWPWVQNFLFMLLNNGLAAFITFFHEIGHTLAGWFYGIPTIPMFDFKYGGGWSWALTSKNMGGSLVALAALGYLWYRLTDYPWLQKIVLAFVAINLLTTFNNGYMAVVTFMGPAAEPLIGAFFLFRAIADFAPRGGGERFMNALLGFALPLHSLIEAYALRHNALARQTYFEQKGGHGVGDFDQLAHLSSALGFNGVVMIWMILALASLAIPFVLYRFVAVSPENEEEAEK